MKNIETFKKLGTAAVLLAFAFTACAHWSEHETGRNSSAGSSFYQEVIAVYEGPLNRLEAVRRGECPMYPSCSQYSKEAWPAAVLSKDGS